ERSNRYAASTKARLAYWNVQTCRSTIQELDQKWNSIRESGFSNTSVNVVFMAWSIWGAAYTTSLRVAGEKVASQTAAAVLAQTFMKGVSKTVFDRYMVYLARNQADPAEVLAAAALEKGRKDALKKLFQMFAEEAVTEIFNSPEYIRSYQELAMAGVDATMLGGSEPAVRAYIKEEFGKPLGLWLATMASLYSVISTAWTSHKQMEAIRMAIKILRDQEIEQSAKWEQLRQDLEVAQFSFDDCLKRHPEAKPEGISDLELELTALEGRNAALAGILAQAQAEIARAREWSKRAEWLVQQWRIDAKVACTEAEAASTMIAEWALESKGRLQNLRSGCAGMKAMVARCDTDQLPGMVREGLEDAKKQAADMASFAALASAAQNRVKPALDKYKELANPDGARASAAKSAARSAVETADRAIALLSGLEQKRRPIAVEAIDLMKRLKQYQAQEMEQSRIGEMLKRAAALVGTGDARDAQALAESRAVRATADMLTGGSPLPECDAPDAAVVVADMKSDIYAAAIEIGAARYYEQDAINCRKKGSCTAPVQFDSRLSSGDFAGAGQALREASAAGCDTTVQTQQLSDAVAWYNRMREQRTAAADSCRYSEAIGILDQMRQKFPGMSALSTDAANLRQWLQFQQQLDSMLAQGTGGRNLSEATRTQLTNGLAGGQFPACIADRVRRVLEPGGVPGGGSSGPGVWKLMSTVSDPEKKSERRPGRHDVETWTLTAGLYKHTFFNWDFSQDGKNTQFTTSDMEQTFRFDTPPGELRPGQEFDLHITSTFVVRIGNPGWANARFEGPGCVQVRDTGRGSTSGEIVHHCKIPDPPGEDFTILQIGSGAGVAAAFHYCKDGRCPAK
ncbi:MAG: hypothetical protein NTY38_16450, partial [Acidobacteria bacterium]|nr:hypothetical protein [Acidobacteriota bacterium]